MSAQCALLEEKSVAERYIIISVYVPVTCSQLSDTNALYLLHACVPEANAMQGQLWWVKLMNSSMGAGPYRQVLPSHCVLSIPGLIQRTGGQSLSAI